MRHVKIDLRGLIQFRELLQRDLRRSGTGPIRAALRQWAARYLAFLKDRFVGMSRGGWPALKPSTIARRRKARKGAKGGGARVVAILRDTGTLFEALSPGMQGKPGRIQQDIPFGVRVGYGGPAGHLGGRASIADIAMYHQTGAGALPVREIIVDPDDTTVDRMRTDMELAVARLAGQTGAIR